MQRLVQAGVLMVAYEQKRAGKIVKAYAPAQDTFDIPFHMTPFSSFAEYMTGRLSETLRMNLEKAYERLDLQEPQISLRVFCRQGVMQLDPVWGTWTTAETHHHLFAAATTLSRWVPLQLTQAELQALQADLEALTARYYRPFEEGDRQTAALGLFLLPN
ncbi:hypothetical protein [Deinococcus aquaedulcis]|uniref:hypothetical protein n=1 Tax=Deinococcus aquaedulcis TaxID=2840455 RepID=UPI001C833361|nr:hypothetical protein [Deinococcus aquaedulcis]